jgi:hypothetical protein
MVWTPGVGWDTDLMRRVSECESVVLCGAAARLRGAAAPWCGGGQPVGLAAAQNISL